MYIQSNKVCGFFFKYFKAITEMGLSVHLLRGRRVGVCERFFTSESAGSEWPEEAEGTGSSSHSRRAEEYFEKIKGRIFMVEGDLSIARYQQVVDF